MKTILEERTDMKNNDSVIKKGIYQLEDGSFEWMTYTRSGNCKTLKTALKKVV